MEDKKSNWFLDAMENWKAVLTAILAIVVVAGTIRGAFWEFWKETKAIQQELRDENREDESEQLAFFITQAIKKEFDSLRVDIDNSNRFFYTNSIKKDSTLLILYPKMSTQITELRRDLSIANQKMNILINKDEPNEMVDFVKILNERDSIKFQKVLSDTLNARKMREIIKANEDIKKSYFLPKYGDRAK